MGRVAAPHIITDDSALGGSVIKRSLRFEGANQYLNRTFGSGGNRSTFTFSCWMKRAVDGTTDAFFSGGDSGGFFKFMVRDDGRIEVNTSESGSSDSSQLRTTAKFRDPSAWFHVVVAYDTTQGTASNRVKIYINGTQVTAFDVNTLPPQNHVTAVNGAYNHEVGNQVGTSNYFDGYLADVYFIDGYQYDASYFGYTESQTGIWRPKRYEETFGTTGFYLNFSDNSSTSALGKDTSGNGNDFTANNFSVAAGVDDDSFTDTPTLNFPTLNALSPASTTSGTLSNGNLMVTKADYIMHRANFIFGPGGIQSGKWYWEVTNINSSSSNYANYTGITGNLTQDGGEVYLQGNKSILGSHNHKTYTSTSVTSRSNDGTNKTMQFLLDVDNQQLIAKYDGTTIFTDTSIPSASTTNYVPFVMTTNSGTGGSTWSDSHFNFGQRSFTYTLPTGYKTLNSKNLPLNVPTIISPQKHFETLLYTGNQSTNNITGLEFEPDFIWVKSRGQNYPPYIFDRLRTGGIGQLVNMCPDRTGAEPVDGTSIISIFDGGFSLSGNSGINDSGSGTNGVVAWCWKAGGAAVSNSDGSITSSVSANTEAGFSIITYTGTGADGTIGHGLGKTPSWVITKKRSGTQNWLVKHSGAGSGKVAYLDLADPPDSTGSGGGIISDFSSSSTYTVTRNNSGSDNYGNVNASGQTYVAYCWAEIPGYSKFGQYYGNGSTDGTYVHLGFRPAWLMIKRLDSSAYWVIHDSKRDPINPNDEDLYANIHDSATTTLRHDFLSNGFKLRTSTVYVNANGGNYIYMAFAEQPGTTPYDTQTNAR